MSDCLDQIVGFTKAEAKALRLAKFNLEKQGMAGREAAQRVLDDYKNDLLATHADLVEQIRTLNPEAVIDSSPVQEAQPSAPVTESAQPTDQVPPVPVTESAQPTARVPPTPVTESAQPTDQVPPKSAQPTAQVPPAPVTKSAQPTDQAPATPPASAEGWKASGFLGYRGGFANTGKGTAKGDGKDQAMRAVANAFVGELANRRPSSTLTSAKEIAAKHGDAPPAISEKVFGGLAAPGSHHVRVAPKSLEAAKDIVVMLARNGELRGQPLSEETAAIIRSFLQYGERNGIPVRFILGDMPGVDDAFMLLLEQLGAPFEIYHTGAASRIKPAEAQAPAAQAPAAKPQAPAAKPQAPILFSSYSKGPERILSNFVGGPVTVRGDTFPTAEHAYQALKFVQGSPSYNEVKKAPTPAGAKSRGRKGTPDLVSNFDRDQVMFEVIQAKARSVPEFRKYLLESGDTELVHDESWVRGEAYWGEKDGKGQNKLGQILMRVREELRGQAPAAPTQAPAAQAPAAQAPAAETKAPEPTKPFAVGGPSQYYSQRVHPAAPGVTWDEHSYLMDSLIGANDEVYTKNLYRSTDGTWIREIITAPTDGPVDAVISDRVAKKGASQWSASAVKASVPTRSRRPRRAQASKTEAPAARAPETKAPEPSFAEAAAEDAMGEVEAAAEEPVDTDRSYDDSENPEDKAEGTANTGFSGQTTRIYRIGREPWDVYGEDDLERARKQRMKDVRPGGDKTRDVGWKPVERGKDGKPVEKDDAQGNPFQEPGQDRLLRELRAKEQEELVAAAKVEKAELTTMLEALRKFYKGFFIVKGEKIDKVWNGVARNEIVNLAMKTNQLGLVRLYDGLSARMSLEEAVTELGKIINSRLKALDEEVQIKPKESRYQLVTIDGRDVIEEIVDTTAPEEGKVAPSIARQVAKVIKDGRAKAPHKNAKGEEAGSEAEVIRMEREGKMVPLSTIELTKLGRDINRERGGHFIDSPDRITRNFLTGVSFMEGLGFKFREMNREHVLKQLKEGKGGETIKQALLTDFPIESDTILMRTDTGAVIMWGDSMKSRGASVADRLPGLEKKKSKLQDKARALEAEVPQAVESVQKLGKELEALKAEVDKKKARVWKHQEALAKLSKDLLAADTSMDEDEVARLTEAKAQREAKYAEDQRLLKLQSDESDKLADIYNEAVANLEAVGAKVQEKMAGLRLAIAKVHEEIEAEQARQQEIWQKTAEHLGIELDYAEIEGKDFNRVRDLFGAVLSGEEMLPTSTKDHADQWWANSVGDLIAVQSEPDLKGNTKTLWVREAGGEQLSETERMQRDKLERGDKPVNRREPMGGGIKDQTGSNERAPQVTTDGTAPSRVLADLAQKVLTMLGLNIRIRIMTSLDGLRTLLKELSDKQKRAETDLKQIDEALRKKGQKGDSKLQAARDRVKAEVDGYAAVVDEIKKLGTAVKNKTADFAGGRTIYMDALPSSAERSPLVFIDPSLPVEQRFAALMHELGHVLYVSHFRNVAARAAADPTGIEAEAIAEMEKAYQAKIGTEQFSEGFAQDLYHWAIANEAVRVAGAESLGGDVPSLVKKIGVQLKKLWAAFKAALPKARSVSFSEYVGALVNVAANKRGFSSPLQTEFGRKIQEEYNNPFFLDRGSSGSSDISAAQLSQAMGAAVRHRRATRLVQGAERLWKAAQKGYRTLTPVMYTVDARMRALAEKANSPALRYIANQFKHRAGDSHQATSIDHAVMTRVAPYMNRLLAVARSLPETGRFFKRMDGESPLYREISNILNRQESVAEMTAAQRSPEAMAVVQELRSIYGALFTELTEDYGAPMQHRADYSPLSIDVDELQARQKEFDRILERHGMKDPVARRNVYNKLIEGNDLLVDFGFHDPNGLFPPSFRSARGRTMGQAVSRALADAGFYHDDFIAVAAKYIHQGVKQSEVALRFGEGKVDKHGNPILTSRGVQKRTGRGFYHLNNDVRYAVLRGWLTPQEATEFYQLVQAYMGRLGGGPRWESWNRMSAYAVLYQNIRLLPMAVLSQLVDPGQIALRVGFKPLMRAVRTLFDRTSRDEARAFAKSIGAITDSLTDHLLNDQVSSAYLSPRAKRFNEWFFRANLMHSWTETTRMLSILSAREFLRTHGEAVQNQAPGWDKSQHYLNELGVTAQEAIEYADDPIGPANQTPQERSKRAGVFHTILDESVLRPNAGTRPLWASDPRFAVLWHLKNFMWTFTEQIMRRLIAEAARNPTLGGRLMAYGAIPVMMTAALLPLAALGYEIRKLITGADRVAEARGYKVRTTEEYLWELVQRSGSLGALQWFVDADRAEGMGKLSLLSGLGPTLDQFQDFVFQDFDKFAIRALPILGQSRDLRRALE